MTHFLSGLMSWMNRDTHIGREDLLTWAKTEYKNDWRYAYHYMLTNNGKAPKLYNPLNRDNRISLSSSNTKEVA
mgnify:FL=1